MKEILAKVTETIEIEKDESKKAVLAEMLMAKAVKELDHVSKWSKQNLEVLAEIDSLYLTYCHKYGQLLKNYILIKGYQSIKTYEDYNKKFTCTIKSANSETIKALRRNISNLSFFLAGTQETTSNNWNKDLKQTLSIYSVKICMNYIYSGITFESLENLGLVFVKKPRTDEEEARDLQARREEAYSLLDQYGLADLLN